MCSFLSSIPLNQLLLLHSPCFCFFAYRPNKPSLGSNKYWHFFSNLVFLVFLWKWFPRWAKGPIRMSSWWNIISLKGEHLLNLHCQCTPPMHVIFCLIGYI
jgi:hypothetical protein